MVALFTVVMTTMAVQQTFSLRQNESLRHHPNVAHKSDPLHHLLIPIYIYISFYSHICTCISIYISLGSLKPPPPPRFQNLHPDGSKKGRWRSSQLCPGRRNGEAFRPLGFRVWGHFLGDVRLFLTRYRGEKDTVENKMDPGIFSLTPGDIL